MFKKIKITAAALILLLCMTACSIVYPSESAAALPDITHEELASRSIPARRASQGVRHLPRKRQGNRQRRRLGPQLQLQHKRQRADGEHLRRRVQRHGKNVGRRLSAYRKLYCNNHSDSRIAISLSIGGEEHLRLRPSLTY